MHTAPKGQKKPHKSIRVFKSDFMERFTHVHPVTPFLFWGPIVAVLCYRSFVVHEISLPAFAAVAGIALFAWTLSEYLLHRFVFHFVPVGAFQERIHFLIHGIHHDDPVDPTRLVMPPLLSSILGVILFSIFRLLLGPVWVEPFFAFFVVGYLCYDYTHYAVHHFTPKTRFGKLIKQNHMLHHYATPNARWGVSTPIWDYIFGTLKEAENKRQIV